MIGTTLGRYRILEEIGSGGMATVYKGVDTSLGREVAIKVLHPHLAGNEEARARFRRKARAVATLHHPNIISIYDYSGPDAEQLYIVTEFIMGKSLGEFLSEALHCPLPEISAMMIFHICEALEHAHSHGVIHRDLKPENILIGRDGAIKVADFGIARVFSEDTMTQTGALVGSLAYMSPEQAEGKRVDHRSDIFSLGALFYRMVTGRGPFDAPTTSITLKNLLDGVYPDPKAFAPSLSPGLQEIIRRCLMREPGDRFQMMSQVKADLGKALAEAGIEDIEEEIKGYFHEPSKYEKGLMSALTTQLIDRAKSGLLEGKDAEALDDLNRVLAIDGTHSQVQEILERIKAKRKRRESARWVWRRGLPAGSALGVIALGVLWGAHLATRVPEEHRMDGSVIANIPPVPEMSYVKPFETAVTGVREKGVERAKRPERERPRAVARVREDHPVQKAPTVSEMAKGSLDFLAQPWARVFIDGQYMGNTPIQRRFSVASGEHTVSLQNPLCEAYSEKVLIGPGETLTRVVTLKFLPGILSIRTDPEVRLLVDGKEVALREGQVRLRLSSGRHSVRAIDAHTGPIDIDVDVGPGETKDLDLRRR